MQFNNIGEAPSANRKLAAERRVVTILFTDVTGSTAMAENLDPEDWAEIMNEAFGIMTRPVLHYGGTVARLMGDAMLAFFGAPTAHEDDPLRAVLAGLEIIEGIKPFRENLVSENDLDFNVRVGINTGVAVVGNVGTAQAGEYTAMGDAVNLASRMEQTAAPGTIQITDETYHLVAPWIVAESIGGTEIKGKSEPVSVYRVLSRKEIPSEARGIAGISSPLVGREREVAILGSMVTNLFQGQGSILTLIGEAGLGKSRLIDELHQGLENSHPGQFRWIDTRGISYEMSRPYGLYVQTLRQVCQIEDDDSEDVLRNKIQNTFQGLDQDKQAGIANTVEILLTAHQPSEDGSAQEKGEALKREIFTSMREIWKLKSSDQPLILVLDDLQWADQASIELTRHLFHLVDEVPILFVCALRPHRESPAWGLRQDAAEYREASREIVLAPLAENESNQLVDNILQISDLPRDLRVAIQNRSEGNPFFIEEVIRTLIESGVIQQEQDGFHWQLAEDFQEVDIPDNLHALLLARIDRLDSTSKRTLQIASVIGRSFYYRVLADVIGDDPDLDRYLENLQLLGLIQVGAQTPELEYLFRHELTRETAYQSILKRQRREYHGQVGEATERLFADNLAEVAYLLAYHYNAARDYQGALKYYQIAGKQSTKLFANREASQYFQRAIELALRLNVTSIRLAQLYLARGRALELINDFDAALDNYEELEELGRTRPDRSLELAGLVPQTTIYSMPNVKFDPRVGSELSRRALNLAIDLRDYEAEAKSLWSLMLIETFTETDLEQAIRYGEQGLRIAREHDLLLVKAHIEHDLARPYMRLGRLNDSWHAYESSQAYWRKVDNLPMLADNLASLAESYYNAGEFEKSIQHANEGLRISKEIGNTWGMAYSNFVIGPILVERGQVDQGFQALNDTLKWATESNFAAGVISSQMIMSWLYAMLGDVEKGRQYEPFIKDFVEQYTTFRPMYFINRAQNELYAGNYVEALKMFDQVASDYTSYSELIFHPYIYTLGVEIHLRNEQYQRALKIAENYLDILGNQQVKILVPDLLNQKARAQIGLGQDNLAYETLQEAVSLARHQNSLRILWALLLDLAGLEANSQVAEEMQEEARAIIAAISENISDPTLKQKFLNLPQVLRVKR